MFPVQSLVVMLGLTLCILPSRKLMAQQYSEIGVVYEAARNKIGLVLYCRNNGLLDPIVADQVITAVQTGLRELAESDSFDKEQGDRAQQAGEEGFWETGRRRDMASVATLFRTTPEELCKEWAEETLRAQAPRPYREVKTITVLPPKPAQPQAEPSPFEFIELLPQSDPAPVEFVGLLPQAEEPPVELVERPPQAEPEPAEPAQAAIPPDPTPATVRAARAAPPPPLPEKAPVRPSARTELVSWQRPLPAGGQLAPTGAGGPERLSGAATIAPSAVPQSWGQAAPLLTRPAAEAAEPLPPEQSITTAAAPSSDLEDQPPPRQEKRRYRRQRCLMPGCRWRTPQERGSWRY